ncbi:hemolysin family protein [Enemella dayhoffiae]|uniref:hemolysin family protein n=1 Tax=Enemella dayhoffiae TaxID=2016507 RepID=UPI001E2B4173|nr:hemolysin family protein [Enemella dayhoffiae]
MLTDILLIFIFIVIGGIFAGAEMALVSLRDSQIKQLAHRGKRGATVARLAANPNMFLSAVQVGVTLSGFLSSAFGGATLAAALAPQLTRAGLPPNAANLVALVLITIVISYFSIVLSELTAKRLAMQRAEGFALALAPMVNGIATVLKPVIWFLGVSTNVAVRVLGGDPRASREEVTDEEIRSMVAGSQTLGDVERQIVDDVFDAGERSLREVMIPRTEVDFLEGDLPAYKAVRLMADAPHSRYPVMRDGADDIAGFVHVRDLFDPDVATRSTPVIEFVRPVLALPETVKVLRALSEMRRNAAHLAIVRDEYGGTAGIVTMEDLVEELVGDITDEYDVVAEETITTVHERELDGLLSLEDFADETGLSLDEGPYDTLAGWFMARRGQLPVVGAELEAELIPVEQAESEEPIAERFSFTVTELDGRRAARILMKRLDPTLPDPAEVDPNVP